MDAQILMEIRDLLQRIDETCSPLGSRVEAMDLLAVILKSGADVSALKQELAQAKSALQLLDDVLTISAQNRDRNATSEEQASVQDESPAQQVHLSEKQKNSVSPGHEGPAPKLGEKDKQNRAYSESYEFLLVDAPTRRNELGRPIKLADIYEVAKAFDPATQRPALTTKLNRMKKPNQVEANGLLAWETPKRVTTTRLGEVYRSEMAEYLSDSDKVNIEAAYKRAWNIDINL